MSLDQLHLLPLEQQNAILDGPAMMPPDGNLLRNFDSPPNDNGRALGIMVFCFTLISIFFFLRLYSRIFVLRKFFLEDYLSTIAYILTVAYSGCCFNLLSNTGYFVHQYDVRVRHLARAFYMLHLAAAFYAIIVMSMKVAILLEWVRIFGGREKRGPFKVTSYIVMVLNVLLYSSSFIVVNVSCKPHDKIWDPTVPGWCMKDKSIMDLITAALNIGSHLVVFALPQGVIWKLQLSPRKKLGISLIFAVGLMALASSAVRLYVSVEFIRTDDKVYSLAPLSLWVFAEVTCIFLIFCIPAIPKIVADKKIISRIASSLQRTRSSTKQSDTNGGTWPESLHKRSNISNSYKEIGDNDISLQNMHSWNVQSPGNDQGQQQKGHAVRSSGIMRTVQIEAKQEPKQDLNDDQAYLRG